MVARWKIKMLHHSAFVSPCRVGNFLRFRHWKWEKLVKLWEVWNSNLLIKQTTDCRQCVINTWKIVIFCQKREALTFLPKILLFWRGMLPGTVVLPRILSPGQLSNLSLFHQQPLFHLRNLLKMETAMPIETCCRICRSLETRVPGWNFRSRYLDRCPETNFQLQISCNSFQHKKHYSSKVVAHIVSDLANSS